MRNNSQGGSSVAAAPSSALTAAGANPSSNPMSRKPPPSHGQSQLAKLREANAKYKQLLKLVKGRIQEQEGLLDE